MMMKFFVSLLLIALLSVASCLYLPWWTIAVAAFLVTAAIPQKPLLAFLCGFFALLLSWGGMALLLSVRNQHLLAHKISQLIIQTDSPELLILVTALIGAVVAGLGALSGSFTRKIA